MAITPTKARQILAKRQLNKVDPQALFDPRFPHQVNFIKDPAKLKALFCTRRAAKSYTAGLYMIYEALMNPGCNCMFIGLTRASAKAIIWKDILKVINKKFNIKAVFNLTELTMTLTNGSVIYVTGIDSDAEEMDKLLGRKYRLVCIDEASMYTQSLEKLVYGILKPAMTDPNRGGDRGTICMMGTSSNYTRSLFFKVTTRAEPGWSLHQWSAHDNPYVAKQWQEELDEIDNLRPLFKETPLYKQWYLNMWVIDEDKLVYKYNPDKNAFDNRPAHLMTPTEMLKWTYILGVDTGWEDDNAFVLTAFHENDPKLYILKTFNKPKMTFDQVVIKIKEFMLDSEMSPAKVIIDGANKQGVESMKQRSQIPFEYADKQGKVDFIEMLNADLIQEKIKINSKCTPLIDEMMGLVWKTEADKIVFPKTENPSLPNHLCDAFLYAWRNGYHYMFSNQEEHIPIGSKRWYEKQAEGIWEREREKLTKEQSGIGDGWPDDDGSGFGRF
jgi:phage terminase large subunit